MKTASQKLFGLMTGQTSFITENVEQKKAPDFGGLFTLAGADRNVKDYLCSFKENAWVQAAVNKKAVACAQGKLRLYKGFGDEKEEVLTHPMLEFFNPPSPHYTQFDLFRLMSVYLDTEGECILKLDIIDKEIWHLEPERVEIKKSGDNFIQWYEYRNQDGQIKRYPPEEIIHIKNFNPEDRYRGLSPIKSIVRTIDADIWADEWNKNFFKNSARPSGLLMSEKKIANVYRERIERKWKRLFAGSKNNSIGVLSGGMKYVEVGKTQKDMDWGNLGKMAMIKILTVLETPPEVLGVMDNANRSSADRSTSDWLSNAINPRFVHFAKQFTSDISERIYGKGKQLYFEYDDPTPANVELDIKQRESDIKTGARTPNEVRADDGRDEVEGGERIYVGFKDAGEEKEEEDKPEEKPEPPIAE